LNLTSDDVDTSRDALELGESSSVSQVEEIDEKSNFGLLDLNFGSASSSNAILSQESSSEDAGFRISVSDEVNDQFKVLQDEGNTVISPDPFIEGLSLESQQLDSKPVESYESHLSLVSSSSDSSDKTVAISGTQLSSSAGYGTGDRTVAVAGYSNRSSQAGDDNVKISVGQSGGGSSGYGGWGSTDSNLAQAENLKIAQSKILELERENEKLRHQNEELVSASEIIKERSDLLTAQVYEYKNDREDLESSFKNEMALIKSQLNRKDTELQKAQMKIEELDSRLKFDMKKIRIRERELENRLELIRAEKNALVRSKDEQILESRRKLDQLQLEVDSFRQKCVELNRVIETNQDSFKRTTRALRLAMANLELQEENKIPLKKVD
ncbi:MAG: hypothetical protein H7235_05735, partial [Bdellovibrionaceae bacterium]|nr:hypothetical protein [Pseudobdellovibrionaceae bacterium]